jgi:hypothetical protein
MADEKSSWLPTRSCQVSRLRASCLWALIAAMRFATDVGPRSGPGYDPRRKVVLCPECGRRIRLEADDWGYCRRCRLTFDGSAAEEA